MVPFFGQKNSILASLTMALPRDRLTSENLPGLISMVKNHALKISHKWGYKKEQKN
jgi:DNA-binding IclR family transcriptional regulator